VAKGGGGGRAAADELGTRKDPKVAKAVAKLLRSPKSSVDARVLACSALGAMGLPECVKPLEGALKDDDYRVVEAAVAGLGATRLPEAAPALAKGVKTLGTLFEDSIRGNGIPYREYEVRLASLGTALDACAKIADPDTLLPAVESAVVAPVFGRKEPLTIHGEQDPRFKDNPSNARMALGRQLVACLQAWGDARGNALLTAVRDAWKDRQSRLAALMDEAITGPAATTGD
jgi:hypothetical protein